MQNRIGLAPALGLRAGTKVPVSQVQISIKWRYRTMSFSSVTGLRTGKGPRARLGIEALERRDLLASSLTASLSSGLLRIEGTPAADLIRIVQTNDRISIDGIAI